MYIKRMEWENVNTQKVSFDLSVASRGCLGLTLTWNQLCHTKGRAQGNEGWDSGNEHIDNHLEVMNYALMKELINGVLNDLITHSATHLRTMQSPKI